MHLFGCSPSAIPKMIQCIDATQLAGSTSEGYTLPEQRHVRDGRTLGCTRAFSGIVRMARVWHMSKSVTKMCDFSWGESEKWILCCHTQDRKP